MKTEKINTFTIAHYILLFFVVVVCIGLVAWVLTGVRTSDVGDTNQNIIRIEEKLSPCAQNILNQVSQIWAYNPELIPQQYLDIATEYSDTRITEHTRGKCNNVKFICHVGDIRRDCDPCALSSARQIAMNAQIKDMIKQICTDE